MGVTSVLGAVCFHNVIMFSLREVLSHYRFGLWNKSREQGGYSGWRNTDRSQSAPCGRTCYCVCVCMCICVCVTHTDIWMKVLSDTRSPPLRNISTCINMRKTMSPRTIFFDWNNPVESRSFYFDENQQMWKSWYR